MQVVFVVPAEHVLPAPSVKSRPPAPEVNTLIFPSVVAVSTEKGTVNAVGEDPPRATCPKSIPALVAFAHPGWITKNSNNPQEENLDALPPPWAFILVAPDCALSRGPPGGCQLTKGARA